MLGAFYWLFLWNFKEKSINHFLWHSQRKNTAVPTSGASIKAPQFLYVLE